MRNLKLSETEANNTNKASQPTTDLVRTYLQEIGRIPLLTHEQEIFFAQQVQRMMAIIAVKEKLTLELKRTPTLQEWANQMQLREEELLQQLNQGKKAKQKMIAANLRLVVSIAKQYQKRNLELLDLIQEGTLGLERGVEKFDPTLGYKFSTYAYWWIRQGITRGIVQKGRTIRLPIQVHEKLNKIQRLQQELSQKLGRIPSTKEIADVLALEPSQIREYLLLARQPVSLEMKVGPKQETELRDLIEDDRASVNSYAAEESLNKDIQKLLSNLPQQQQEVLILHFGLVDGNGISLSEIARRMDITRAQVRQLERKALKFLQRNINIDNIKFIIF
ncbi:RNA polymerase sigma factor, RpoD/SigA family [Nostoc sp. 106C]|uniref:RNA polymerase sigma factor, RpoD/SigA family n=1 Tax=Nostoc sp. 106C TaxID=1932667 RepID=UPI000A36A247|nr:RNA polymerase sigma factor, RpoD/SigA family [Nostoc sp. 106C]OUL24954.1 RNA polymerase subunit sigma [Nostoc sp. 106C]